MHSNTPNKTKRLERQIAPIDHEIDNAVYELYNLTPEEIKMVEETTG